MTEPLVRTTRSDWYATITMAIPQRRNALSLKVITQLTQALEDAGASDLAGVMIAGEGPVFSSGHDFADMAGRHLGEMRALLRACADMMLLIGELPQVVMARVQGPALAAGCQLVAACDLAVAVDSATFSLPGGKGGWFCHTPSVAVARAIGRKQIMEMALTGDPIDARTAVDWGLLNRAVPAEELDQASEDLLARATRGSKLSKAMGKHTLYRQMDLELREAYDYATEVMAASSQTRDGQESMTSFIERRPAKFVER
ncbi:enoyl-CoA hydratase-related protein [Euzebya tangerina]|uniref:enoyl-CoA hydratase-related protein n=1 Tax=Euzebya tangerina TaxID=591198 RepID=UPI000E311AC9|nr:enoyl-CoA hydratase-related protein [Euzebya tangerina]